MPSYPLPIHSRSSRALRIAALSILLVLPVSVAAGEARTTLDGARIARVAAWLPAKPQGVGRPIADRATWDAVARLPGFRSAVSRAEGLLKKPIPELTDELFLDFSKTGNRNRCQAVIRARHGRLPKLVLAECIENHGRFLPAIEETIRAICAEKTWVLPAHDRSLSNFKKTQITIDLVSSATSWQLATADYWLGDKLDGELRQLIRSEINWRTFEPYQSYITTGKPRLWWATGTNNWNAVCLAGVTGAGLALIDSAEQRAEYVVSAEHYIGNFLRGFTSDGYCSEGLGYWNYGFGNFALLAETMRHATGGKVDLWERENVEQIARFGRRMEVIPGVYPAFADCHVGSKPGSALTVMLDRRFDFAWGLAQGGAAAFGSAGGTLSTVGLYVHEALSEDAGAKAGSPAATPLREWFSEAGILICRPAAGNPEGFGVALKGGHNAEHHNHNDVGSYMVALAGQTPLVDPGSEVYTARTFSSKRYESGVLNSFGHPVPRVAGQLQRSGRAAAARVLSTDFSDQRDVIALDIKAAYPVKGLEELHRQFTFSRQGRGSLTVTDTVRFDGARKFGTALVTFSPWKKLAPNRLSVGEGDAEVTVEIGAGGVPFEVHAEEIHEDVAGGHVPVRIGIDLAQPVREAAITVRIAPVK